MPPFPESPRCLSPVQGNLFSLHCLDFQAEDRLTPRWHVGQPCGKASWESLEGMGLISPGRENILDFLELRQVLSTFDGDLRDPLWWPQERPVPLRVARGPVEGLLGFLSRRCWGLKPCV